MKKSTTSQNTPSNEAERDGMNEWEERGKETKTEGGGREREMNVCVLKKEIYDP